MCGISVHKKDDVTSRIVINKPENNTDDDLVSIPREYGEERLDIRIGAIRSHRIFLTIFMFCNNLCQ